MDGIIVILIIGFILSGIIKKSKSVDQKRPGQAPPPARPTIDPHADAGMPRPEALERTQAPARPASNRGSWTKNLPPELMEIFGLDEKEAPKTPRPSKPRPRPASREGQSRVDPSGCVGGSIPHAHAAPAPAAARPLSVMAPQEYTAPVARVQATHREEADFGGFALPGNAKVPALTAAEMRRAVITAEVLNRPVALRRRGFRM